MQQSFPGVLIALCLMLPVFAGFDARAETQNPDLTIDGVPLPGDVAPLDRVPAGVPVGRRFAGTWVGAWGGDLKTILTFESIGADGTATAIYAVGDHDLWGIKRGWWRFSGRIEGKKLRIKGRITEITYELAPSGRLLATYARRNQRSRAVLTRQSLAALRKPGATVPWIGGKRTFLKTGLIENGKRIRLEAVVFRPAGTGPFPLAVVNHGSTGRGNDPRLFRQTFIAPMLAEFLSARGWLAAFPQRRGRGRSDGLYDEGFNTDRAQGYTCETKRSRWPARTARSKMSMRPLRRCKRGLMYSRDRFCCSASRAAAPCRSPMPACIPARSAASSISSAAGSATAAGTPSRSTAR